MYLGCSSHCSELCCSLVIWLNSGLLLHLVRTAFVLTIKKQVFFACVYPLRNVEGQDLWPLRFEEEGPEASQARHGGSQRRPSARPEQQRCPFGRCRRQEIRLPSFVSRQGLVSCSQLTFLSLRIVQSNAFAHVVFGDMCGGTIKSELYEFARLFSSFQFCICGFVMKRFSLCGFVTLHMKSSSFSQNFTFAAMSVILILPGVLFKLTFCLNSALSILLSLHLGGFCHPPPRHKSRGSFSDLGLALNLEI